MFTHTHLTFYVHISYPTLTHLCTCTHTHASHHMFTHFLPACLPPPAHTHTHTHTHTQAKEKEALQQQEKAQEEDDNYTELCNHIHGDVLTENPDVAQSAFGSHRVIPDRWKGMSRSQVEEIRVTREVQKQEKAVSGCGHGCDGAGALEPDVLCCRE